MNKNLLILLFFSLHAFSKEMLLFENDSYRLYDVIDSTCNHLFLYNKESKKNLLLNGPIDGGVNLAEKNCFSKENKESIKITFFPSGTENFSTKKKLLRVNYDLDSNILVAPNEYQKIHYSKCAIIDVDSATFISDENAREEVCTENDFVSYIFPNIGLPITWEGLFAYVGKNKFTDSIEYEVNNYISVLLSVDYKVSKINDAMRFLANSGYINQVKMLSDSSYTKIKEKSYLYSDNLIKSNMYLIKGDKVRIIKDKLDDKGIKWYFINYKGKKEINMWIKADSVNIK
ncbi:hypothetical protein [Aggregatibacter actinomycetemcomitans]|uniref:hypothetical protein n=1 Tax=Aggregatibacter actinomycetemcomitans TaxID=714 RepID=UPI0006A73757|nr:hypothetical protein [Aggregatibacter actinomycetemcomitans]KOE65074.1 hypothetical protein A160_0205810 [Aggregatibacter actinomycetemcomitans serotype e str. A160]KOE68215.1 hypothetical protein SCC393_0302535 [Aggregatibacter actinomycetemcomitans serotype e str. SCC393]KYK73137.1 hypothetical protein SA2876_10890 [Aggregatibacter actinomycetemcomitans serotype e str. SA2876]